jgi:hypothetical protein
VLFTLLRTDSADRSRQVALLRQCLACWVPAPSTPRSSIGSAGALVPVAAAPHDIRVVHERLGALLARCSGPRSGCGGTALGWPQVVELADEAGLGPDFTLG